MNCEQVDLLIHGYLDEELDVKTSMEISEHIEQCGRCANNLSTFTNQSKALKSDELYYHPSQDFRKRVYSAIRKERRPWYSSDESRWRVPALALSLVVLFAIVWAIGPLSHGISGHDDLIQTEILDSHVRALLSDHITDVLSTDQHTVKPWFNDKIDYSPDVKNLDAEGFILIGGRLEYIDGKPVAVIVYRRAKHIIDLYSWPEPESHETSSKLATIRGYHMITWNSSNSTYCVVSDVEEGQLEEFREQLGK
ncbi:MAG: anti-sigma factor [Candidatus Kryptoniota bacterium]